MPRGDALVPVPCASSSGLCQGCSRRGRAAPGALDGLLCHTQSRDTLELLPPLLESQGQAEQGSRSGERWLQGHCHWAATLTCGAARARRRPTACPCRQGPGLTQPEHTCTQIHLHTLTFSSPLKKINRTSVVHILN